MLDFRFVPRQIGVAKKSFVSLTLRNAGRSRHNFTLRDSRAVLVEANVDVTKMVGVSFLAPSQAGRYEFFCKYHRDRGMKGTLVVR